MAGEDQIYVDWVRAQPCAACAGPGPCEAHHSTNGTGEESPKGLGGRRGKGQRGHDHESFPLHTKCHRQFHDARGFCEGWDRAQRRAWQDEQVRLHRERYEAEHADDATSTSGAKPKKQRPTVKQEAEALGSYHALGPQVVHDIERVIRKALKGEISP